MTSQPDPKDGPPTTRMDEDRLRRLLAMAQEDFARLRLHAKPKSKERWGDTSFAGGWCALPEGYLHALAEMVMDRALFDDSDSEVVPPEGGPRADEPPLCVDDGCENQPEPHVHSTVRETTLRAAKRNLLTRFSDMEGAEMTPDMSDIEEVMDAMIASAQLAENPARWVDAPCAYCGETIKGFGPYPHICRTPPSWKGSAAALRASGAGTRQEDNEGALAAILGEALDGHPWGDQSGMLTVLAKELHLYGVRAPALETDPQPAESRPNE